jgi:hypothetical protein
MKTTVGMANLLIIGIAISIPVIITDQYLRFGRFPKNNARIMLLSGGRLDSSGLGIRHYTPNSSLRHSAVYDDVLEYTYVFNTDKNGFRVTYKCNASNAVNNLVAIAGDSFTEGQGSKSPWTARIQKQLCDRGYDSINTSIAGYGVEEMKDSLDYAYSRLGAKKAIVAIILDDIYRPRTPMTSNSSCSTYESRHCGDSATWWHHPYELTSKDIIKFANSKYDFGILPALRVLTIKFKSSFKDLIKHSSTSSRSKSQMNARSISAMNSIALKYGVKNVLLIILPTKNDLLLEGSPKDKTRRSAEMRVFLNSLNKDISVKDLRGCPLDARHFFRLDGHPNDEGHKQLGNCASK